ncbi:hypothetical protein M758_1G319700, partial [Ceratodon purpureus]
TRKPSQQHKNQTPLNSTPSSKPTPPLHTNSTSQMPNQSNPNQTTSHSLTAMQQLHTPASPLPQPQRTTHFPQLASTQTIAIPTNPQNKNPTPKIQKTKK